MHPSSVYTAVDALYASTKSLSAGASSGADDMVPVATEVEAVQRETSQLLIGDLLPLFVGSRVDFSVDAKPLGGRMVLPIRLTTISNVLNGLPRQFSLMWENMRYSILFHLLVPGG
jgi:hypothetical protein